MPYVPMVVPAVRNDCCDRNNLHLVGVQNRGPWRIPGARARPEGKDSESARRYSAESVVHQSSSTVARRIVTIGQFSRPACQASASSSRKLMVRASRGAGHMTVEVTSPELRYYLPR